MAFRVGQKVVYVDVASPPVYWRDSPPPKLEMRAVYTVTAVKTSALNGKPCIQAAELPTSFNGIENWYQASRFRPVVERKTDISIFEKMLTGGKQPARVA